MSMKVDSTLVWTVIGVFVMMSVLFYFVARREERNNVIIDWKSSSQKRLLVWAAGITLFTVFASLQSSTLYWIIVIGLRFVVASFVGVEASKLGRNKNTWMILGFVEYHIALSLLYFRPRIFVPSVSAIALSLKVESIQDLFLNGLITEWEAEERFSEICEEEKTYVENERMNFNREKENSRKQVKIEVLQKALDLGMISVDEFEEKRKRIN